MQEPLRIISDLHLGHPASLIADPSRITPLLNGIGTLIFNGDSAEMRSPDDCEEGRQLLETLRQLCLCAGVQPVFINGNHDPSASEINHLDLAGGSVLVTHGDMLFHDISPWSKEAELMRDAHTQALQELDDAAFADFEKRLVASKRASMAAGLVSSKFKRGAMARLAVLAKECWPPARPWRILKVWKQTPDRAVDLARVFRPRARFLVVGHTHYQGIWKRGPRVIINTGSFTPPLGRLAIDSEGDQLTVRRIDRRNGRFEPGRRLAGFKLSRLQAHEGF